MRRRTWKRGRGGGWDSFFGLAKCGIGHACASDPELADSLHGHDGGSAALLALTQCCCFLHVSRRPRRIEDAECGNARSRDGGGTDWEGQGRNGTTTWQLFFMLGQLPLAALPPSPRLLLFSFLWATIIVLAKDESSSRGRGRARRGGGVRCGRRRQSVWQCGHHLGLVCLRVRVRVRARWPFASARGRTNRPRGQLRAVKEWSGGGKRKGSRARYGVTLIALPNIN